MLLIRKFILGAVLVSCLISVAAIAYVDKVLVIVNEDVITQSEFDFRLKSVMEEIKSSGKSQSLEGIEKQLLEGMISDKLQMQEAARRGITISEEELAASIQRFATQQSLSVTQLKQELIKEGRSYQDFARSVRDALTLSRLSEYYMQTRVEVPAYEIDGYIAQHKLDANSSEYNIAHILIRKSEENKPLVNKIINELQQGLEFTQAAQRYSQGGDAQEGGVLGWRSLDQLPEIYSNTIKQMQVNQVSSVLESDAGFHIIKLLNTRGGERTEITQSSVQHILISAKTNVAKQHASKQLSKIKQRVLAGEDFSKLARTLSDDSVSAANGGSLGWVSPGQMVPSFEQAFEQLNIGEVSEPVMTQYGVHLIKVTDRRVKNVSDQVIRSRAENVLRRQRADREFKQWVRELREQAYVEYINEAG